MKRFALVCGTALLVSGLSVMPALAACNGDTSTETVLGAGSGAAVGGLASHSLAGAAIGGVAGGLIGNAIGHSNNRDDCRRQAYAEDRPALGARAIGVPVADTVMELLQPTGPGVIADHLRDHGEGLRSTVLGARDMAAVRSWCADRALPLEAGSAADRLAVPAAANHGVMIEFASV